MKHNDPPAGDAEPGPQQAPDPLFDGHLEKPLLEMTVQERLDWIDQMMRFRHWASTMRREAPPGQRPSPSP